MSETNRRIVKWLGREWMPGYYDFDTSDECAIWLLKELKTRGGYRISLNISDQGYRCTILTTLRGHELMFGEGWHETFHDAISGAVSQMVDEVAP